MPVLSFINQYISVILVLIGAAIYLGTRWKQGTADAVSSTIKLLQDEVVALQTRLNTTSSQVATMSTQVLDLTKRIDDLTKENDFLKRMVNEALKDYLTNNREAIEEITKKLQK